ncbi:hypothetical protein LTR97_010889 [Elasticomyces elasticus]|uniref:MAPEG family protein n=1 Tax=Elasticomyces elasticus TaxID=574655 RepID=A0AAN7VTP2_9PEZI|nr:hypothetical protein LTR97_010889 [Elasticomyces elasticus]
MASYLPNFVRDNVSFYTIPIALVIALAPRFYAANAYEAATKKPASDQVKINPRSFAQTVSEDQAVDSKTKGRILRAEAAISNSYENLGLFAAAVTAGNMSGVATSTMNGLSIGYIAVRFAYNHIYIFQDLVIPQLRSAAYLTGVGLCMAMFVQAGMAMNARVLL